MMPADVYIPDSGKLASVKWLALFLSLAVLFSVIPVAFKMHLDVQNAPLWARLVLILAVVQAIYVAWMLNAPDWASVWVVMLVFAGVAALYGTAAAIAVATPLHESDLVMSLATYLCGRTSAKWRRAFELERGGGARPIKASTGSPSA